MFHAPTGGVYPPARLADPAKLVYHWHGELRGSLTKGTVGMLIWYSFVISGIAVGGGIAGVEPAMRNAIHNATGQRIHPQPIVSAA